MEDHALQAACDWLRRDQRPVKQTRALAGGCICQAWLLSDDGGRRYFVKTHDKPPPGMFAAEAAGLEDLGRTGSLRTPAIVHVDTHFLLLDYIESGPAGRQSWEQLGRALAENQSNPLPRFGYPIDNFCGRTPQINTPTDDGHAFFTEYRLRYQGKLAVDANLMTHADMDRLQELCARIETLIPRQQAVLLHGDLWSGNVLFDSAGAPVLIDPASYWGWAEADIGMTALFGGFDRRFYAAWDEAAKPLPGWQDRLPLYNLYHLLNHLNLFGRSYHSQVQSILKAYS